MEWNGDKKARMMYMLRKFYNYTSTFITHLFHVFSVALSIIKELKRLMNFEYQHV